MIDINLLPKTVKRQVGSKYLRFATAAFVVLALLAMGGLQVWFNLQENELKEQKIDLALELNELQPILDEQADLLNRQRELLALLSVRDEVKRGTVTWSQELAFMLENLPPPATTGRPAMAFNNLSISALEDARSRSANNASYEGLPVTAQMQVSGLAQDAEVLADYIQALQIADQLGVSFSNASLDQETGFYNFNLTVGLVTGEQNGN